MLRRKPSSSGSAGSPGAPMAAFSTSSPKGSAGGSTMGSRSGSPSAGGSGAAFSHYHHSGAAVPQWYQPPNYVIVVIVTAVVTLLLFALSPLSFVHDHHHHHHHHHGTIHSRRVIHDPPPAYQSRGVSSYAESAGHGRNPLLSPDYGTGSGSSGMGINGGAGANLGFAGGMQDSYEDDSSSSEENGGDNEDGDMSDSSEDEDSFEKDGSEGIRNRGQMMNQPPQWDANDNDENNDGELLSPHVDPNKDPLSGREWAPQHHFGDGHDHPNFGDEDDSQDGWGQPDGPDGQGGNQDLVDAANAAHNLANAQLSDEEADHLAMALQRDEDDELNEENDLAGAMHDDHPGMPVLPDDHSHQIYQDGPLNNGAGNSQFHLDSKHFDQPDPHHFVDSNDESARIRESGDDDDIPPALDQNGIVQGRGGLPPVQLVDGDFLDNHYSHDWPANQQWLAFKPRLDEKTDMIIVYASQVFGNVPTDSFLSKDFHRFKCHFSDSSQSLRVLLTSDVSTYGNYGHSFVFHGPDVTSEEDVRVKQNNNEIYIYHTMENPLSAQSLTNERIMSKFDLLMSYSFKSDIFLPYLGLGTLKLLTHQPITVPFHSKDQEYPVAWYANDCSVHNGRDEYLKELFEYLPTKRYGECLKNTDESSSAAGAAAAGNNNMNIRNKVELANVLSQHKFVIVFEEAFCMDYITHELERAILSSTVPIVFSAQDGKLPNYDLYLPRHSYINAAKFESTKQLARFVLKVSEDESLYNEYLSYKHLDASDQDKEWDALWQRYNFKQTNGHWCRAAKAVRNELLNKQSGQTPNRIPVDHSCLRANNLWDYMIKHPEREGEIEEDEEDDDQFDAEDDFSEDEDNQLNNHEDEEVEYAV